MADPPGYGCCVNMATRSVKWSGVLARQGGIHEVATLKGDITAQRSCQYEVVMHIPDGWVTESACMKQICCCFETTLQLSSIMRPGTLIQN